MTTRRACEALAIQVWDDPHNDDDSFARVRVRRTALPALEASLGPGVAAALARTARLAREDADVLDAMARSAYLANRASDGSLEVSSIEAEPPAIRHRVLRLAAIRAGSPPSELSAHHIEQIDALVTNWHGQSHLELPGPLRAVRRAGRISFAAPPTPST